MLKFRRLAQGRSNRFVPHSALSGVRHSARGVRSAHMNKRQKLGRDEDGSTDLNWD